MVIGVFAIAVRSEAALEIRSLADFETALAGEELAVDFEATVWYCDSSTGRLVLHDATDTAEVQMDLRGHLVQPGDQLTVAGQGMILNRGTRFEFTQISVVDNNGLHGPEKLSGSVWLEAGRHPIRLEWFNAIGEPRLSVEYAGPSFERRSIPSTALFRTKSGLNEKDSGLEFRTYQARWWELPPSMSAAQSVSEGLSGNFDLTVTSQKEYVGIEFSGFLEIEEAGEYTFSLLSDDGSRLFIGPPSLNVAVKQATSMPGPRLLVPGQVLSESDDFVWASVEGKVSGASRDEGIGQLSVDSGIGQISVEIADVDELPLASLLNKRVRMTGVVRRSLSLDGILIADTLLVQSSEQVEVIEESESGLALTSIEQVERLDRSLLDAQYIVRIQGVVTNPIPGGYAIVMQDEKRAIFVDLNLLKPGPIELGDLLEIVGTVQAGEFSPIINATQLKRLGTGVMPDPLEATRDELLNGSLHSQYVEIEGYVLAVDEKRVVLRTHAGILNINMDTETSVKWLNSVVSMRGCLRSFWDAESRKIEVGKIELNSTEIRIVRAAPLDPFDVARKGASDLLKFDPNAEIFQRVRLVGHVLHEDGGELYLMDQEQGVRVSLDLEIPLVRGDLVEIAGFPEFDGPSTHFANAIVRKVGHESLPLPRQLPPENLLSNDYDSTLVSVDGDLIGMGLQDGHWTMQLRSGQNVFSAPLVPSPEKKPSYEVGSRLRLTGVYVGMGGNRTLGQPIEGFEILLASIGNVEVLVTPPWWTMPRLLSLVGTLCVVLLFALLWIKALHRQVAARSAELSEVLEERHRVEQEEALASERSRLAYDLHDELGAGLTEVALLGALAGTGTLPEKKRKGHLTRLTDTVRQLVMSLDEIVWAVNPNYDSVSSFVGYYTSYAQQFLGLASVRCRFDVADELPEEPLSSRVRHSLFLAFKEALTNVVRHAQASEVIIRIYPEGKHLVVVVSDNGCGLKMDESKPAMDGLDSIRDRLHQLGGQCVVESDEQTGTTISLKLPLQ